MVMPPLKSIGRQLHTVHSPNSAGLHGMGLHTHNGEAGATTV